jgi:hypothetical protein
VEGRLFTLVSADDYGRIFAWGMEITHDDGSAAVIYRWDPMSQKSTHGVHSSAEGARGLYSRVAEVPLVLVWMEVERLSAALT